MLFWKTRAQRLKTALIDTRNTLDEFQRDSRDYEEELEHNIEIMDAQNKELRNAVNALQLETEHWKEKYQEAKNDANAAMESMQREIQFLKASHQKYKELTRTLEQDNDDLERFGRVATSSLRDIELKLNQTMERNAFLESELEAKNQLVVVVQRLKDEIRDLQLELSVLRSKRASVEVKRHSVNNKPEESSTSPVKMVQEMLGRVKVRRTHGVYACLDRWSRHIGKYGIVGQLNVV
jgi:chromosome segregation ATPase